jgi:hypothetical protein
LRNRNFAVEVVQQTKNGSDSYCRIFAVIAFFLGVVKETDDQLFDEDVIWMIVWLPSVGNE